ncbi:MAG: STAS domain-containing protein, partial [Thermoflexales bacterium]|nr:STAS domain-containing protein [Thermoflexales bacterium]
MSTAVTALNFFLRPLHILRAYRRENLGPDLVAGLTVATIALPQAMAYAFIAELPPQVGLYTAIVGSIVGGLWGSSNQLQTGPSNAASLLVLSVLLSLGEPGTPDYLARAGLLALMVGLVRLGLGLARLGKLADFVSDSVVVGFTAGAGLLIFFNQLRHLLRLDLPSTARLDQTLANIAQALPTLHWPSLLVGLGAMAVTLLAPRLHRRLPGTLASLVVAAAVVGLARLDTLGVKVVGAFPPGLPELARLPLLDWGAVAQLSTGALAIAAIGLVEAMSVARTIAGETSQRIDSNQEFVGQGLASIACGLFSGYVCSGSPARSMVNYYAGASSALASVASGLFVLLAVLVLAPLASSIPLAALAGVVMLVARRLINDREMRRIWRGPAGDRLIMAVTLLATLALPLEYAVLSGIAVSLAHYLLKTSTPRVRAVLPDESFEHFVPQLDKPACPQLEIVEVHGDLYFGSVNHVEDRVRAYLERTSGRRFLLLRMHSVENCDISGIHMLERVVR